jgi:G3E family GTPase
MAGQRIPLTVIGGFLGAGKTTLLNRLLRESGGRRLAVLVNDFGAINIDAALVSASGADTIALTNGCVCCSIGDDLSAALIKVLGMRPRVDAVLIEASGVSDPWRIAQIGLADPELGLDGVIVLVDASAVLEQSRDPRLADSLRRQLRGADAVIVNKADLAGDDGIDRVRRWVTDVAGPVGIHAATRADVPMALLTSAAMSDPARAPAGHDDACHRAGHDRNHGHDDACHPAGHDPNHDHADHAERFDTWSRRPAGVFSMRALRAAVKEMPAGVLRLKGVVRTDEYAWAEVQFAGRHGSVRAASAAPPDGAALVAIGLRGSLPADALDSLLASAAS